MNIHGLVLLIEGGVSTSEVALATGAAEFEVDFLRERIKPSRPVPDGLTLRQQLLVSMARHRPSYRDDSDLLFAVDQLIELERSSAPR